MKTMSMLLASFALFALIPLALAGDADELKKLQGIWEITELVVGGIPVADKEIAGMKFVFKDKTLTVTPPKSDTGVIVPRTFSVSVDAKKQPIAVDLKALDGELKDNVSPGILEIKGDTLRWCQSDDPKAKDRPSAFASPEKSAVYLFTFKKAKDAAVKK